jgi:hypothetical protein
MGSLRSRGMTVAVFIALTARLDAQGVMLRIHPRVGDTLHTRLEQQTEVSTTVPGSGGRTAKSVTTSVVLNSRTIVQSSSPASTVLLTIVDSADLRTSDAHGAAQVAAAERSLRGQQLVLRLGADGTVESARDARGVPMPRDVVEAMAAMPAVFPRRLVLVGETWTRELPLPSGGPLGTRGAGRVNAVFRLDSLDRAGTLAYVSMRGEIVPDGPGEGVQVSGAVHGAMLVDRLRGWMTDSHFVVTLHSLITPPAATGLAPMRFVTRVTQRLRTMDKR